MRTVVQAITSPQVRLEVRLSDLMGCTLAAKLSSYFCSPLMAIAALTKVRPVTRLPPKAAASILAFSAEKALSATVRLRLVTVGLALRKSPMDWQAWAVSSQSGLTIFFHHSQHMKQSGKMRQKHMKVRMKQPMLEDLVLLPTKVMFACWIGACMLTYGATGGTFGKPVVSEPGASCIWSAGTGIMGIICICIIMGIMPSWVG